MNRECSRFRTVAGLLAMCGLIALVGCVPAPPVDTQEPAAAKTGGAQQPAGAATDVLMLGRSVMGGWFQHWGHDGTSPVEKDGFSLRYREIEGPEGIGRSASEAIREAAPGSTVFFKFCFVDFAAQDVASARAELERNKGYVDVVVSAAEERGVKLIIGNALPNVASQTNRYLVKEHRDYNAWLEQVASEHSDTVRIFDEYSVLADADGALKVSYAVGSDDAHLNETAYTAMDEAFFEFSGA